MRFYAFLIAMFVIGFVAVIAFGILISRGG